MTPESLAHAIIKQDCIIIRRSTYVGCWRFADVTVTITDVRLRDKSGVMLGGPARRPLPLADTPTDVSRQLPGVKAGHQSFSACRGYYLPEVTRRPSGFASAFGVKPTSCRHYCHVRFLTHSRLRDALTNLPDGDRAASRIIYKRDHAPISERPTIMCAFEITSSRRR